MRTFIQVKFDQDSIRLINGAKEEWALRWKDVEQIGYRTTSNGPIHDYFLVFKKRVTPPLYYNISMDWSGAIGLSKYIDCLPDTKLPIEGKLANCIEDKSVTVWPANKSGESIC
jgi:hypothetical protein